MDTTDAQSAPPDRRPAQEHHPDSSPRRSTTEIAAPASSSSYSLSSTAPSFSSSSPLTSLQQLQHQQRQQSIDNSTLPTVSGGFTAISSLHRRPTPTFSIASVVDSSNSSSGNLTAPSTAHFGLLSSDPLSGSRPSSEPTHAGDDAEYLDYLIKGQSRSTLALPTTHWASTAAAASAEGDHDLASMLMSDSLAGDSRRSLSNPRTSLTLQHSDRNTTGTTTATTFTNSSSSRKVSNSDSSEMLPLSEFLSQSLDRDKSGSSMSEDAAGNNPMGAMQTPVYRLYNPPPSAPSPPPPTLFSNHFGRVPITTASGEFSGFQQYTPPRKDVKFGSNNNSNSGSGGGRSRGSTLEHDGSMLSQPTLTSHGLVGGGRQGEEDDSLNQDRRIKNYKVFPGRNVFLCGGRIMTSRDFPAFIMAILLLLIPTGLFYGFTSPYLWHRLSPAAVIVQAYIFIITFSSMLKTSWTDPGVLPRGIDGDPPVDAPQELDMNSASFYPPRGLPRLKEVQVGMYTVRLKYCDTCRIYRPPRCSHCRQCDNCVEDEDHHCIWLNNCIGRRNYRFFLIFVTTASLYAFLTFALCLTHLLLLYHDHKDTVGSASFQMDALAKAPVSALVMIYAVVMGLAVGSLAGYHFWLATMNRTTHEQLVGTMMRPEVVENPFDRGNIFKNCAAVFFRPPTRSYIRRRDYTIA
ncbi:Palmitoyltransferase zdhhc14 [Dissophora globulifera]|nr:Palmitoyltransferase zdhhc14 [Dissophora globulifera]